MLQGWCCCETGYDGICKEEEGSVKSKAATMVTAAKTSGEHTNDINPTQRLILYDKALQKVRNRYRNSKFYKKKRISILKQNTIN